MNIRVSDIYIVYDISNLIGTDCYVTFHIDGYVIIIISKNESYVYEKFKEEFSIKVMNDQINCCIDYFNNTQFIKIYDKDLTQDVFKNFKKMYYYYGKVYDYHIKVNRMCDAYINVYDYIDNAFLNDKIIDHKNYMSLGMGTMKKINLFMKSLND